MSRPRRGDLSGGRSALAGCAHHPECIRRLLRGREKAERLVVLVERLEASLAAIKDMPEASAAIVDIGKRGSAGAHCRHHLGSMSSRSSPGGPSAGGWTSLSQT